jgi:hypothetical protein
MDDPNEKIFLSQIPPAAKPRMLAKSISSVLDRVISERGYAAEQSLMLLQEAWRTAAGEEMYQQTRVGRIQRGVLQIFVCNSIVLSELQFIKRKSLAQLQRALPDFKLKDIRFQLIQ